MPASSGSRLTPSLDPATAATTGSFDRRFVTLGAAVEQVRVQGLPELLPVVWRRDGRTCVELPCFPADHPLAGRDIDLVAGDSSWRVAIRPTHPGVTDGELGLDVLDSVVRSHVECIERLTHPEDPDLRRHAQRAEQCVIISEAQVLQEYWRDDADQAPLHLVVRIADECSGMLEDLCQRPRFVLRRARRLQDPARVQQVDDACLQWLARHPGKTIREKAGPRNGVLGVVRLTSIDTLENRVLRDFMTRCEKQCGTYLKDYAKYATSARYQAVARLHRRLRRWMRLTPIGDLPGLAGPPVPNYVLLYDDRYARLWHWYERLRRHQEELQQLLRWRYRVQAERLYLATLAALRQLRPARPILMGRYYLREQPQRGTFVHDRSPIGPINVHADGGRALVDVVRDSSIAHSLGIAEWAPDFVLIANFQEPLGRPDLAIAFRVVSRQSDRFPSFRPEGTGQSLVQLIEIPATKPEAETGRLMDPGVLTPDNASSDLVDRMVGFLRLVLRVDSA